MQTPPRNEISQLCQNLKFQATKDIRKLLSQFASNCDISDKETIIDELSTLLDNNPVEIELTVGCNDNGDWSYQTGDNSYVGDCYGMPYWAVETIAPDSDVAELADSIIGQLAELRADAE